MRLFTMTPAASVALVAATLKRVLYLKAGADRGIDLSEWWVEFDGTSAAAVPVLVTVRRVTTDVTGHTAITPVSQSSILSAEVSAATGGHSGTGGGTNGDILANHLVPPTSGKHVLRPLGDEHRIGKAERIVLECTAPANVNVMPGLTWRE